MLTLFIVIGKLNVEKIEEVLKKFQSRQYPGLACQLEDEFRSQLPDNYRFGETMDKKNKKKKKGKHK